MLEFSFLNFHKAYFDKFNTGENEFKIAIVNQARLIKKMNPTKDFICLCDEANELIQSALNKNETQPDSLQSFDWNTTTDVNLRNSFSKGLGNAYKAIAIQYLIFAPRITRAPQNLKYPLSFRTKH